MLETYLRPIYQKVLINPFLQYLRALSFITPCWISVLGCIFGLLSPILLISGWKFTGLLFLLISGYLDTLDGSCARDQNKASNWGSALDIVCDRTVELGVILGFAILYKAPLYAFFMLGSVFLCVTTFLVVGIFAENSGTKSFHYSKGLVERGEAFVFFIAMILFPQYFCLLSILFSSLVFITAVVRMVEFYSSTL